MKNKTNKLTQQISGLLLLDKPSGITSNAALQQAKRLFHAKKAGHTGSLDPLASGMLPIAFGAETKFSQYLLTANKKYWVQAELGVKTASGDRESEVIVEREIPELTQRQIDEAFQSFRGNIKQVPSMYSALKHRGQPLYKLARQGIEVTRKGRIVTVFELNVLDYQNNIVTFEMHCSKGTYVRTLVDDFGEVLGCGAHVIALRRLSVAQYQESQMITLETLKEVCDKENIMSLNDYLLPTGSIIHHWPEVILNNDITLHYLRQGQAVMVPHAPTEGWVRISNSNGKFIGIGEIDSGGKIAPRRLA